MRTGRTAACTRRYLWLAVLAIAFAPVGQAQDSSQSLTTVLDGLPSVSQPLVIDLDGDLQLELVLGHAAQVRIGALHSDAQQAYPLDGADSGIVTADLNADGAPELMSKHFKSVALFQLEDGSFEAGNLSLKGKPPQSGQVLAADDIDDDGFTDLLIGEVGRSRWWGRDAESVSFRPLADLPELRDARMVDLDADGGRDLLMHATDGTVSVMARQKIGFDPRITAIGKTPVIKAVADLDNDGNPDILLDAAPGEPQRWLRNEGEFKFSERKLALASPLSDALVIVDLDNDGYADIVDRKVGHWFAGTDPRIGFERKARQLGLAEGESLLDIADLDGDGWREFVVEADGQLKVREQQTSRNGWLGVRLKPRTYDSARATKLIALRRDGMKLTDTVERSQGLIGLGPLRQIDLLAVYWSSGAVSRIEVAKTDRYFDLDEPPVPDLSIKRRKPGTIHRFYLDGAKQCR